MRCSGEEIPERSPVGARFERTCVVRPGGWGGVRSLGASAFGGTGASKTPPQPPLAGAGRVPTPTAFSPNRPGKSIGDGTPEPEQTPRYVPLGRNFVTLVLFEDSGRPIQPRARNSGNAPRRYVLLGRNSAKRCTVRGCVIETPDLPSLPPRCPPSRYVPLGRNSSRIRASGQESPADTCLWAGTYGFLGRNFPPIRASSVNRGTFYREPGNLLYAIINLIEFPLSWLLLRNQIKSNNREPGVVALLGTGPWKTKHRGGAIIREMT
jgi:hypothetical protein